MAKKRRIAKKSSNFKFENAACLLKSVPEKLYNYKNQYERIFEACCGLFFDYGRGIV